MPTKHEILEELDAIEDNEIYPGKYVRFESTPSKAAGRTPVHHEGKVVYVDFAVGEAHKSPTVFYEGTKADGTTPAIFKNKATKLEVIDKPKSRRTRSS